MRVGKTVYGVLLILPLAAAIMMLFYLPEQIPAHYGVDGQADRWGSKFEALILPGITLLLGLAYLGIMQRIKRGEAAAGRWMLAAGIAFLAVLNVLNGVLLAADMRQADHLSADFLSILFAGMGILYIVLGCIMPGIKMNSLVGLRTSWSMKNERVWRKCQQFGGKTFLVAGVLILAGCLLVFRELGAIIWTMTVSLAMVIIDTVYSYRAAKTDEGAEQL